MKREYEITMSFTVSTDRSVTAEDVAEYADQLAIDIKECDELRIRDDVNISEITVHNIEDNNFDDHIIDDDE